MVPDLWNVHVDVGFASGDHLIGDLHKERRHSLGRVVVRRDAVDHPDRIHQARDVFHQYALLKRVTFSYVRCSIIFPFFKSNFIFLFQRGYLYWRALWDYGTLGVRQDKLKMFLNLPGGVSQEDQRTCRGCTDTSRCPLPGSLRLWCANPKDHQIIFKNFYSHLHCVT